MRIVPIILTLFCAVVIARAQEAETGGRGLSFRPDATFQGSKLDEWKPSGDAEWQAAEGEIVAKAKEGGGYLAGKPSYQDVALRALFKTTAGSEAGFLFRLEKVEGGTRGVLVSVTIQQPPPR